jgi:hypothetical protein
MAGPEAINGGAYEMYYLLGYNAVKSVESPDVSEQHIVSNLSIE